MTLVRLCAYAGLAVVGAATGVAGALVQGAWFPGGLLLALLAITSLTYGGAKAVGTRVGAAAPAGGWLVAVLLLTATRPEGDFLFSAGVGSYVFLLGGMMAAVMCATLPQLSPPADRKAPPAGRPGARLGK
ncbi:DUF6113 family protein [Streptomyces sp. URMC 123]|uniref:DUF6113 family protein n=1 Tax=Streptomyces sp. URMC 123 TaxID=3423403 RepID=UPI003F19F77A